MKFLTLSLLLLLTISAHAQAVSVVEKLPDGSYVVSIEGVEYRAITADQARAISTRKVDLEMCQQKVTLFQATLSDLSNAVQIVRDAASKPDPQVTLLTESRDWYKARFQEEHDLRLRSQDLATRGRLSTLFDNPWFKFGEKAVNFGLNSWIASRQSRTTVLTGVR
jgi:hypothetical protein